MILPLLSAPPSSAEEIKVKHGSLNLDQIDDDEMIELPSVGGRDMRRLPRKTLINVIEPRYSELLTMVKKEIYKLNENC
ncbi:hypothetical protein [Psychromonas sp. MME2]|uniref:hypothetical protein n=1 Tax=Psychromonas sp. MME2 TaxID=3231033 RepID=UPI00339BE145